MINKAEICTKRVSIQLQLICNFQYKCVEATESEGWHNRCLARPKSYLTRKTGGGSGLGPSPPLFCITFWDSQSLGATQAFDTGFLMEKKSQAEKRLLRKNKTKHNYDTHHHNFRLPHRYSLKLTLSSPESPFCGQKFWKKSWTKQVFIPIEIFRNASECHKKIFVKSAYPKTQRTCLYISLRYSHHILPLEMCSPPAQFQSSQMGQRSLHLVEGLWCSRRAWHSRSTSKPVTSLANEERKFVGVSVTLAFSNFTTKWKSCDLSRKQRRTKHHPTGKYHRMVHTWVFVKNTCIKNTYIPAQTARTTQPKRKTAPVFIIPIDCLPENKKCGCYENKEIDKLVAGGKFKCYTQLSSEQQGNWQMHCLRYIYYLLTFLFRLFSIW